MRVGSEVPGRLRLRCDAGEDPEATALLFQSLEAVEEVTVGRRARSVLVRFDPTVTSTARLEAAAGVALVREEAPRPTQPPRSGHLWVKSGMIATLAAGAITGFVGSSKIHVALQLGFTGLVLLHVIHHRQRLLR